MPLQAARDDEATDEEEGDDADLAEVDGGAGPAERQAKHLRPVLDGNEECSKAAHGVEKLIAPLHGGGRRTPGGRETLERERRAGGRDGG